MKKLILALALSLITVAPSIAIDFKTAVNSPRCQQWVDSVMSTLSPRQRAAQLFCPVVNPKGEQARAIITRYAGREKMGGLLLRAGSIDQYVSAINAAQAAADVPVLITLDGEWGLSMRVSDTPRFPYNMALGAISDTRLLEEYGTEVARECREMGIQVDFAPVADVNLNPANPVIGRRSFGEDPERVAAAVVAYSRGMENGGVITTAKHFPGHGDTSTDSHKTLPVVDHSAEFMRTNDLTPFIQYINAGLSGIMVGHLSIPSLDPSGTPASLSRAITTGLLRDDLGFDGLIFTDALEMKGAVSGSENNCVSALKAGADMLLSSANPPVDLNAVMEAVNSGDIPQSEIDRRCRKLLAYKWAAGLTKRPTPVNVNGMKGRLNTREALSLIERLTAASATVTGNTDHILPIQPGKSVALVNIGAAASNELATVMKNHGNVTVYSTGDTPLSAAALKEIKSHDIVVAALYNDKATSASQLAALRDHDRLVTVMFMTPYKAMKFKDSLKQAAAMVMMYDDNRYTRAAAGDAIYAGNDVSGRLPVSMPGIAKLGEGVSYKATRLSFSTPHAANMAEWLNDSIDAIARQAVRAGAFPGLQVMVIKDGHVVADRCYGRTSNQPTAPEVTPSTLFDLASVSKAIGTLPGIMWTCSQGNLDLDTSIDQYVPALKGTDKADLTPRMLLYHESGMPSGLDMYNVMIDPDSYTGAFSRRRQAAPYTIKIARNTYAHNKAALRRDITSATRTERFPIKAADGVWVGQSTIDTLMQRIYDAPLKPRTMRYSCLNFCLLMDIEQRLTGTGHDRLVAEHIFDPIDATSLCYRPLDHFPANMIASTERDPLLRRQTLTGFVHDELACFSGGVQGNAGLFGNAADLAKVCTMYLNGGSYAGRRVLDPKVVKDFTSSQSPTCRRGLGFDRPDIENPNRSPVPEEVPASAYGHTGFTGTCFWVDPDNNLIYIFLSNRVNPSRDNSAWLRCKARSRIHSLIYRSIV
ncbi:MAG: serine hydrolase [Muribaculaceae bacterium]|nr:serine hydrolase [Muribaculaceae bacterium]